MCSPCSTRCPPGGGAGRPEPGRQPRPGGGAPAPDRVSAIVVADATCNTGARHPLATSLTVAALSSHAMLPGDHFARYAAQMIALDPQVQRYALDANAHRPNRGDRPHPDLAAHRGAAARAGLPAAGARAAGPRPARPPRRHRPEHPSVGPARAARRVRRDPGRRAREQPRQPRGVHRGAAGVPRPGDSWPGGAAIPVAQGDDLQSHWGRRARTGLSRLSGSQTDHVTGSASKPPVRMSPSGAQLVRRDGEPQSRAAEQGRGRRT